VRRRGRGKSSCTRKGGSSGSHSRDSGMPRSTVAADAGDALIPIAAEAEGGDGVNDERKAELAVEGCVALLVEGLESREALSKEPTEKTRLPWAVLRLEGRQDRALGSGIHLAKDVRKRCCASSAGAPRKVRRQPAEAGVAGLQDVLAGQPFSTPHGGVGQ
jgi:hypothetical protein